MRFKCEIVENFINNKCWSHIKFCLKCGITNIELKYFLNQIPDVDKEKRFDVIISIINKISKVMKINIPDFFE